MAGWGGQRAATVCCVCVYMFAVRCKDKRRKLGHAVFLVLFLTGGV